MGTINGNRDLVQKQFLIFVTIIYYSQVCLVNLVWMVPEAPRETRVSQVPPVETVLLDAQVLVDHLGLQVPWLRVRRCRVQQDLQVWMVPQVFPACQDPRENVARLANVDSVEKTVCPVIVAHRVFRVKRVVRETLVCPELREKRETQDQLVRMVHRVCRVLLDLSVNPASKVYLGCLEIQDRQDDRETQDRPDVMVRMVWMASQVYLELRATEARLEKMELLVSKVYLVHKVLRVTLARQDYLDTKDPLVNKETLDCPALKDLEVIGDRQDRLERLDCPDLLARRDPKVCPEMRVSRDLQENLALEDPEEQR